MGPFRGPSLQFVSRQIPRGFNFLERPELNSRGGGLESGCDWWPHFFDGEVAAFCSNFAALVSGFEGLVVDATYSLRSGKLEELGVLSR
jgi:hypothetical protein